MNYTGLRYIVCLIALLTLAACVSTESARPHDDGVQILSSPVEGRPHVVVKGDYFRNVGYVSWSSSLSLSKIEEAAIYINRGIPRITVSVYRDGKLIYQKSALSEVLPRGADTQQIPGIIAPKPDAPGLMPNDVVVSGEWFD